MEGRLEVWLGCWEGWEEVGEGREVWRERRLEGRGGGKGGRRNEVTRLGRGNWIALALEFSSAIASESWLNDRYGYQRRKKSQKDTRPKMPSHTNE